MFILPYLYSTLSLPTVFLHRIRILTWGGTELWQEENILRLREDILEPNELPLISHHLYKNVHLCLLDETRLNLSEYYDWEEIPPSSSPDPPVFCWRTFYVMEPRSLSLASPASPASFLSPPPTACLGPYTCEELLTHLKPASRIHI